MAAPIAEIRDRLRILGGVVWIPQGMTGDVLAIVGGYAQHTIENLMLVFGYTYFQKLKHKTSTIYYYKKIMA